MIYSGCEVQQWEDVSSEGEDNEGIWPGMYPFCEVQQWEDVPSEGGGQW
jgi:hypothetical protein